MSRRQDSPNWEHFHHVADIGVRGRGATMAEAFGRAAVALTAVITDPGLVRPIVEVAVECSAPDPELLLADWLNAIIYEMATRHMLFADFAVTITGETLHGRLWGEAVDLSRHAPAVEVKGATYTALKVWREKSGQWLAQCVVDV